MLRLSAVLVAALLLPVAGQAFAGACDPGPPTGAEPPVVTHLRSYPWAFRAPTRLALAADSSLLVSDPGSARVVTRDAEGRITGKRRIGSNPISLAVDAQKRIYVGDGDIGRVRVFSRNWEFLYDLGSGSGEFALPGAIATDTASGRIYVADSPNHRVRVFNADGGSAFSFGAFGVGAGLFKYPAGLFVDAAEAELYVVDQLNFQVQVFDLDGGYLRCIGGTDANPGSVFGRQRPLNQPQGVWIDAGGRVFVSDAADGRIKVFDRSGNALAVIGEFGSIPGAMRIPTDLVIDAHNRLFVASANNARLEVYGIDGYEDIERIAPGVVEIEPATLDRNALPGQFSAIVELPGYRLDAILADTLRLNGIPALSVEAGDVDRDTAPDLLARFDAAALAATLPVSGPRPAAGARAVAQWLRVRGRCRHPGPVARHRRRQRRSRRRARPVPRDRCQRARRRTRLQHGSAVSLQRRRRHRLA